MTDIFSEGREVQAQWASFKNIGDSVQGTYIGRRQATDGFNNEQIVYELKQSDGSIVNVGVRVSVVPFHERMKHIRLGQIVGVKYTEQRPVKNMPGKNMKVLSVYADDKIVDKEWLKSQEELRALQIGDQPTLPSEQPVNSMGEDVEENPATPAADEPFESKPLTDQDKLRMIGEFATAKLGVSDPMVMKEKVMEVTKLPFISSNLDSILDALRRL